MANLLIRFEPLDVMQKYGIEFGRYFRSTLLKKKNSRELGCTRYAVVYTCERMGNGNGAGVIITIICIPIEVLFTNNIFLL